MTPVVKAHQAADFLALVPYLAGFRPRNSLVLVAFTGTRTSAAIRFDLPADDPPRGRESREKVHRRFATSMIGMLCKVPGVDAVVPVIYTDDPFDDGTGGASGAAGTPPMPHRSFAGAVIGRAEMSGMLVRDALCVASDGWGSYLDDECPAAGRPLNEISASAVNAEVRHRVPEAGSDLREVADGWQLPTVDVATTERVARHLYWISSDEVDEVDLSIPSVIDGLVHAAEHALTDPGALTDDEVAELIFHLIFPPTGDAVMLQWAFGPQVGRRAFDENRRFLVGEGIRDVAVARLLWGDGPRPDPQRVEAAITLVKWVAACAPRGSRPPLLCTLAWLNWALGRSSVAHRLIEQCYGRENALGEDLRVMLDHGHLPEWAFAIPESDLSGRREAP